MENVIFDLQNIGMCYRKAASMPWKGNKFWALHDVSFQVHRGQTVGIIGRNGAGKSTLLKVIAGIIKPDKGTIMRANVSITMQSLGAGFDQRLTGRQNIFLSGLLLGMDKKHIHNCVKKIIELADIGDFIDEPINNYSSGMRSRLGFSIAYYVDTDVMLIDEALAAGDHAFQEKASELIKQKIKSDKTVVLVSHSIPTIQELCDRVIQIESGHSLPELPVDETIKRYVEIKKKQ
ncbi:MAG: ABC transporter ATP-binding protein [Sedimentisphaerales bacterium]|nr:ABC transporter ATP-binding protein [Sedimentisphaerales bacterium]